MVTMPCPSCGHPNHDVARFCEACGAALTPAVGASAPPVPPGPDPTRRVLVVLAVVLVALAVVLGLLLVLGDGDDGGDDEVFDTVPTTASTTTSSTTTTSTTTSTTTTTTTPPADGGGGPGTLPAGLFCRDLVARGYGYADAVAYWDQEGRPDRMDADRNGYPCETVYPSSDVIAYWGFDPQAGGGGGVQDLPAGLYCRDLDAMGYSYADAVGYWNVWGQPDRMDADRNGYPCETVYPSSEVIAYWGFDPP